VSSTFKICKFVRRARTASDLRRRPLIGVIV
jgi:hypothetical protein